MKKIWSGTRHAKNTFKPAPIFPHITSKTKQFAYPHYSDSRFDQEKTLFGRPEEGLEYEYKDRMDPDKSKKAWKAAKKKNGGVEERTAKFYELFLTEYYGKKVYVKHITGSSDRSNGSPRFAIGFKGRKKKK